VALNLNPNGLASTYASGINRLLTRLNWIERLPIPERSGAKGAVLALFALWSIVTFGGGVGGDAWCGMHPWSRLCGVQAQASNMGMRRWKVIWRIPGKGKGPKQCTCHLDETGGGYKPGAINHELWSGVSCSTKVDYPVNEWQKLTPDGVKLPGMYMSGERIDSDFVRHSYPDDGFRWRWHCTDDPKLQPFELWIEDMDEERREAQGQ